MDRIDPADPIDRIDPADPIDAMDPADPIDISEPTDETESIDPTELTDRRLRNDTGPVSRHRHATCDLRRGEAHVADG